MDSITQIALGSAVAVAARPKLGRQAVLLGAIGGTIADLDVLVRPFTDEIGFMGIHRGFTHSLIFAFLLAPVLGVLLEPIYRRRRSDVNWFDLTVVFFWSLWTHPILDAFTAYGTQLLLPFSNARVSFSTLFIVDPFYTIPLMVGMIAILIAPKKIGWNRWGIYLSSIYLLITIIFKMMIMMRMNDITEHEQWQTEQTFSTPFAANPFIWSMTFLDRDTIRKTNVNVLDENPYANRYRKKPVHSDLIDPESPELTKLVWVANGMYTVKQIDSVTLHFTDERYADIEYVDTDSVSGPIFAWRLVLDGNDWRISGRVSNRIQFDRWLKWVQWRIMTTELPRAHP